MIYKRCNRCGKRIPEGQTCPCQKERHKEYDRYSRDKKSKAFYDSSEWIRVRDYVLSIDTIDVYEYMTTGRVTPADTVHHIIPLRDDWSRRCDVSNLISLSASTHSMIEQQYKTDKRAAEILLSDYLHSFRELFRQGAGKKVN